MAKESLSLQNHIVWLCFILSHKNAPIMHNPDDKPSIVSYFSNLILFSTFTQYMSVSHGYNTMGGIQYNEGGYVENTKKEKVSH